VSPASGPAGFLRLLVVFHESEALGAGRSLLNVVDELAEYGWSTTGWLPGGGPLADEAATRLAASAQGAKPLRYSVRGWRAPPGVLTRLRATPLYLRSFRETLLRARPHVVHANTLRTLPEARVARSLGLPVVIHVHELPDPGLKRTAALRVAGSTADAIVAVSEAVARVVRPLVGETPVLVARNGVPPFEGERQEDTTPTVGAVGSICRTKGTDVYLEAASLARAECPELRFEHIGQAGLDEDVAFERRIATLVERGGSEGVHLLGSRPAREGLARWELLVHASRQDAFPLVTLEAMAAGVPVLATAVGGVPEQLTHLETGVLAPADDPRALAEWIVRLHREPALRARLAAAASDRVQQCFTVERQAATLHRAYLAALNLRHGPPPVRERMKALR